MKKIILLLILVFLLLLTGCVQRQLTHEQQKISSVSDTSKCRFIKAEFAAVKPQNLTCDIALITDETGGDSYKIVNTVNDYYLLGGVKSVWVNFEIYKCKSDGK